jgi:hypothetical protein
MPIITIGCLIGSGVIAVQSVGNRWPINPQWVAPARIGLVVVLGAVLVWAVRLSWLNAGVVTEIAVTGKAVFWRKQNVWGFREYIWPLSTIKVVRYDPRNRSLRIHRTQGAALNAFAYFGRNELEETVQRLSNAIEINRTLSLKTSSTDPAQS